MSHAPRYFVRITPANALYALLLSLRGPVAAWKLEVPAWLGRRFGRVRPYRIFSRDEWLLAHDRAFDLWKSRAFPLISSRYRHVQTIDGDAVDFSRNVWQLMGVEFEALCLFVAMVARAHAHGPGKPVLVEPRIGSAFRAGELQSMFPEVRIASARCNRVLEHLHEWLISCAHLARELLFAARGLTAARKSFGERPVAWLGISAQEIAERDDRLDFAWAARHGELPAADVLYFVPQALTPAQRAHYDKNGIAYLEPRESYALLPVGDGLRVAGTALVRFVRALGSAPVVAPLLARLLPRASYWAAAFRRLRTRTYVTTTSYSWPEKPELALCAARAIRSIIWAYSANSLTFSVASSAFRDLGIARSIVIADEFRVWNRAYGEWLEKRRVESRTALRIVGPLMCGDAATLVLPAPEARARLGLPREGLCIGVFDMPPISDVWRDRFGGGPPMVDTETYVEFWRMIERTIVQVPGSYALVKLKRDFTHAYREFPDFLRALLDENGEHMKAGRLRRVDVNVDPFLPIAACDIAIGIAYTSPVLAARTAGKPGYYLDPLARANHPSHPDYRAITLTGMDALIAAVERARAGENAAAIPAPAITPPPSLPFAADIAAAA